MTITKDQAHELALECRPDEQLKDMAYRLMVERNNLRIKYQVMRECAEQSQCHNWLKWSGRGHTRKPKNEVKPIMQTLMEMIKDQEQ